MKAQLMVKTGLSKEAADLLTKSLKSQGIESHVFEAVEDYVVTWAVSALNTYVALGRVSGCEDDLVFIKAENREQAGALFTKFLAKTQEWDFDEPIYIEHLLDINNYRNEHYIEISNEHIDCQLEIPEEAQELVVIAE